MDKQSFMQACRQGTGSMDAALRSLYRDYRGPLMNVGMSMLPDSDLVHDVLQETVIKAWVGCASFRGESELFPWLKTIYRNAMRDLLRRRPDEVPLTGGDADTPAIDDSLEAPLLAWRGVVDPAPEQALQDRQSEACYRACAAHFAREHPLAAFVIHLVVHEELGNAEIAALLGRTPAATRQFVSVSRKTARRYLGKWYDLLERGGAPVSSASPAATNGFGN